MYKIKPMPNGKVTIKDVYEQVDKLREDIRETYVTKAEFTPVKACVYGFVALLMTTVLGAIIAQVVRAVQ